MQDAGEASAFSTVLRRLLPITSGVAVGGATSSADLGEAIAYARTDQNAPSTTPLGVSLEKTKFRWRGCLERHEPLLVVVYSVFDEAEPRGEAVKPPFQPREGDWVSSRPGTE